MSTEMFAWDGTAEDFWRAIAAVRGGCDDTEADHALLVEVIEAALAYCELLRRGG